MAVFFALLLLLFGVYSYTQIDLNLTILQSQWFLSFQNWVIRLGYFNRPLSAFLFILILLSLYIFYIYYLVKAGRNRLQTKEIIFIFVALAVLGILSYPAFSHDFFNYMFDARILTTYGKNPYLFKALDFPGDNWLRFMHWVHRTYPYGPVWLAVTLPFSYLGFGKFVLTLLNFKLMFLFFYLGSSYLVYRISRILDFKSKYRALVFYSLNPMIIIESLVSPHLDGAMLFFALLAAYLMLSRKKWSGYITMLLSAGTKFITAALLPVMFIKRNVDRKFFLLSSLIILLGTILVIFQREPYPWYFVVPLGLAALAGEGTVLGTFLIFISAGLLLRYLPFIYVGSYPPDVQNAKDLLFYGSIAAFIIYMFLRKIKYNISVRSAHSGYA